MTNPQTTTHQAHCYCADCDNKRLLDQAARQANAVEYVRFAGVHAFFAHIHQVTGHNVLVSR